MTPPATQEPKASSAPPELTGADVTQGIINALRARDSATDPAMRESAGRAILQGASLLSRASMVGGDSPGDVARRDAASGILRALDTEGWRGRMQPVTESVVTSARDPNSGEPLQQRMNSAADFLTQASREYDERSSGLDELFRKPGITDAHPVLKSPPLVARVAREKGIFGVPQDAFYVRPELADYRIPLVDDLEAKKREEVLFGQGFADQDGKEFVFAQGERVELPVLDDVAKASITDALKSVNPWSIAPRWMQELSNGAQLSRSVALMGGKLFGADPARYGVEPSSADPNFKLPFTPNLSGVPMADAGSAELGLSLARLRNPAWARAVRDEAARQVAGGGARATVGEAALGAVGFAAEFAGFAKVLGLAGKTTARALTSSAVASRAPVLAQATRTLQGFADAASASTHGAQPLPRGLVGTGQMVAYENVKAALTGGSPWDATKQGVLMGAAGSLAHVVARPITAALATAVSRAGIPLVSPMLRDFEQAVAGKLDAENFWQRLVNRPSQDVSIRDLVGATTRNVRWANTALQWVDSFAVGGMFGAWEAARAQHGSGWDSLPITQKVAEVAKQAGSNEAVGTGLGFAAVGMLYAGATHSRFNPSYEQMQASERAAVDRMAGHITSRLTGTQFDLKGWEQATRFFEAYRQAHPAEFTEKQAPKAPPPGGAAGDITQLKKGEGVEGDRFAKNRERRERFREQAKAEFDVDGNPASARAKAYFERHPVVPRGTQRAQEIRGRFMPATPRAELSQGTGASYGWDQDLSGDPSWYVLRSGGMGVQRVQQVGETDASAARAGWRSSGWAIVHTEGDLAGERVQNTKVYGNPVDAMSQALAIEITKKRELGYRSPRVDPGKEPPPGTALDFQGGPEGPVPSPVAPTEPAELEQRGARGQRTMVPRGLEGRAPAQFPAGMASTPPGELRESDATGVGGQRAMLTEEEMRHAQATVDAHHADPDHAGKSPLEVVQDVWAELGRPETPEEARAHETRMQEPEPVGAPKATVAAVEDGRRGAVPMPHADEVPSPADAAGLETPVSLDVARVNADPKRFQFKSGTDNASGVREQDVGEAKFDPRLADIILVWQDKGGQHWVVDGHHRLERAKRSNAPRMNAWVYREADGVTEAMARALGAIKNIAGGKADAVDAAKLIRDLGWTEQDLRAAKINTKSGLGRSALGLSKLTDQVFLQVVNKELAENHGALIGRELAGQPGKQVEAARVARELKSEAEVAELVQQIRHAPEFTETQADMFGSQTSTRSLVKERAQVGAAIKRKLGTERALFRSLATKANTAQRVEGNKIDVSASADEAKGLDDLLDTINRLGASKGTVSTILNEAAERIALGEAVDTAARGAIERLGQLDWKAEADIARPVEAPPAPVRSESLFAAEVGKKPAAPTKPDPARIYTNQVNAHAGTVFNILHDAGLIDANDPERLVRLSEMVDALNRGDRAVIKAMAESGAYKDNAQLAAAHAQATASAKAARVNFQKALFDLTAHDTELRSAVQAYMEALQSEADNGTIGDATRAKLREAGIVGSDGSIDRSTPLYLAQLLERLIDQRALRAPGPRAGANGFTVNPLVGFTALVEKAFGVFTKIDAPAEDYAWVKATRMRHVLDRLLPTQRAAMNARVNAGEPFLPKELTKLAQLYNRFVGGVWSNAILPSRVLAMNRSAWNTVLRPGQSATANQVWQLDRIFQTHLVWDGKRVSEDNLRIIYDAIDSGAFRSIPSADELAKRFGEERRFLFDFMVDITRAANAVLDQGVELGRFDPRQADAMRSRWIPHEEIRQGKDLSARAMRSGDLGPIIDRHSLSRSARAKGQATILHHDPYYLFQRGLRQEIRTNSLLQMLKELRDGGHAVPHESTERAEARAPTWHAYQRAAFESAALGDLGSTGVPLVDPVTGGKAAGRQVRFAMVLRQMLDGMQPKADFDAGLPRESGKRGFSQDLHDLIGFYLGPDMGRPDPEGRVRPGAFVTRQLAGELDWMIDEHLPREERQPFFAAAWGTALQGWKRNVTVMSPAHWITNQASSIFTNWGDGRVPVGDYVTSILYGKGRFADAMRDASAWQDFIQAGKPTAQPANMTADAWERARRFERTANQLHGGLFVNTVVKGGGIKVLLGTGVEPDAITEALRAEMAANPTLGSGQRTQLEASLTDFARRMSVGHGSYEKIMLKMLDSRSAADRIAGMQGLHAHYAVWELVHKHAAALAQMERFPLMSPERAAVRGATGTVDYGDTNTFLRTNYNDPTFRRSAVWNQTESWHRTKNAMRYVTSNPFSLYMLGGVPRWTRGFVAHPARSGAILTAAAGLWAAMWAAAQALSDEKPEDMLLAMSRSRGFEGMPAMSQQEAAMFTRGMGSNPSGPALMAENVPQDARSAILAHALMYAPGTAPAPGGMVSDVSKLVPQADLIGTTVQGLRNFSEKSLGDHVRDMADVALGWNADVALGTATGLFDFMAAPDGQRSDQAMRFALTALRRATPQTGDLWFLSRGGQDAIGSMLGGSLEDHMRAMPQPSPEAAQRVQQAAWRFLYNARKLRPYTNWKDERDFPQALLGVLGVESGDKLGQARPEQVTAARTLAQWTARSVASTYSNFRHGKYTEPATLDSLVAWQHGLALDLKHDTPLLELVDEPKTPIGQFIKGQVQSDAAVGNAMLEIAHRYFYGPAYLRGIAPVLQVARTRTFDPSLVEEMYRSSAADPSGSGLLKMALSLARRDPSMRAQAWAIYRNLMPPDPGTGARAAYDELRRLTQESESGILHAPPLPDLLELFGSQAFQGGAPANWGVLRQRR